MHWDVLIWGECSITHEEIGIWVVHWQVAQNIYFLCSPIVYNVFYSRVFILSSMHVHAHTLHYSTQRANLQSLAGIRPVQSLARSHGELEVNPMLSLHTLHGHNDILEQTLISSMWFKCPCREYGEDCCWKCLAFVYLWFLPALRWSAPWTAWSNHAGWHLISREKGRPKHHDFHHFHHIIFQIIFISFPVSILLWGYSLQS